MSDEPIPSDSPVEQDIQPESLSSGRLHRVTRLMALAIKCESLIQSQILRDHTDIACLGRITKPRVTQIMNLLNLAPDIQEYLLFLPPTTLHWDPLSERHLRGVTKLVDWSEQRRLFALLCAPYAQQRIVWPQSPDLDLDMDSTEESAETDRIHSCNPC